MAHFLLVRAQLFDPRNDRARGWQYMVESTMARERGDLDEATRLLRDAAGLLPGNDVVIANLGIVLANSGHHEQAIEVLERALRGGSDLTGEVGVWVALAWSYLRSGRAPKALETCDRAVQSRIDTADTRILRGLAQGVTRGFVARDELGRLIRLRPRMVPMVLEFCQHLACGGSRDVSRQIVRAFPQSTQSRAFQIIARSALNQDDTATAQWAVKELESLAPGSASAHLLRSEISLREGNTGSAAHHARKAAEQEPGKAQGLDHLTRALLVRGEWDQATKAAAEALERKSTDALSAAIVALSHLDDNDVAAARKVFVAERTGDALGCAYGHAAQAVVLASARSTEDALHLATESMRRFAEAGAWATSRPVKERLCGTIRQVIERVEVEGGEFRPEALDRVKADVKALEARGARKSTAED